jgi:hypothetical protein
MKSGVGSATFTRASTATYIDRYGVLKTAAIDEPRFEKEGYLNEGASTNNFLYSNAFDHTNWGNASNTLVSGAIAPDDTSTATLATTVNTDSCAIFKNNLTIVGNSHTVSIFVKAGTSSSLTMRAVNFDTTLAVQFNLSTKTANNVAGAIVELANGWFRCSTTFTFTGSDLTGDFYIYLATNTGTNYSSTIGNSMYIFGAQLESLPFATSYIPTTTASVTRAADVLNVTRANNMPNCQNNSDGLSVSADYKCFGLIGVYSYIWGLYSSTANMIVSRLTNIPSLNQRVSNSSGNASADKSGSYLSGRVIGIFSNSSLSGSLDGQIYATTANTTGRLSETQNTTFSTIRIGNYNPTITGNDFYGHISNFRIYNKALTAQEVALA